MDRQHESRLAEMLGVKEDSAWRYPGMFGVYRIHAGVREYWDNNNGWLPCDSEEDLIKIIKHPEAIDLNPLSDKEKAIMRTLGATLVIRDKTNTSTVLLFKEEPKVAVTGTCGIPDASDPIPKETPLAIIDCQLFPNLAPGSGARL